MGQFLQSFIFVLIVIILGCSKHATAAQFKGYEVKSSSTAEFNESVVRFIESQKEFLILFSKHSAFYRFPKKQSIDIQIRDFLEARSKTAVKVRVKYNPMTAEIQKIEDLKN